VSDQLLIIDTATRHALVALCGTDGAISAMREWDSPHRHGEQLLPQLDSLFEEAAQARAGLAAVAVGIGPGSFTGLRIGLATAKVIAYTLDCPIIGLSTAAGLAAAAAESGAVAVVLPAGTADRYVARHDGSGELTAPALVPASRVQGLLEPDDMVVAVDLADDELGASAAALGRRAQAGLAEALARAAAQLYRDGGAADLAALVPSYVALPRGVASAEQEVAWSPDLR
jgi:tRNA threonylcarbamoyladenosine biosynthesis protein TsaB